MDAEEIFRPLKIDHAMLKRDHVAKIEAALDSVWDEANHPYSPGWIEAAISSWALHNGHREPGNTARDIMMEAASLGLIVKRGGRWRRASSPSSRRRTRD